MPRDGMSPRDFLESLLVEVSGQDRDIAMERAYDAMEAADAQNWPEAVALASDALKRDPLNPWALMVLNDATIGQEVGGEDATWETPEVQVRRIPGLLAAFAAGQAVAFAKQSGMAPPLGDVWNMVEARPYVRAARSLMEALELLGHDKMAARVRKRLRAQGVWQVQDDAEDED